MQNRGQLMNHKGNTYASGDDEGQAIGHGWTGGGLGEDSGRIRGGRLRCFALALRIGHILTEAPCFDGRIDGR